jgi:quaternary ammonium compound-resistance protein SugE
MNWLYLILGGLFEVGFTTCLGLSNNFRHLGWSIAFLISVTLSMVLLGKAAQTIPLGTAYAVWTGIGAVGTAIVGIFLFKEPAEFWRLFFIALLIGSIVGLKAVSH